MAEVSSAAQGPVSKGRLLGPWPVAGSCAHVPWAHTRQRDTWAVSSLSQTSLLSKYQLVSPAMRNQPWSIFETEMKRMRRNPLVWASLIRAQERSLFSITSNSNSFPPGVSVDTGLNLHGSRMPNSVAGNHSGQNLGSLKGRTF